MKTDVFSVVAIPTLACNGTCTYCFGKPQINGADVDLDFWKKFFGQLKISAEKSRIKKVSIFWQGGEIFTLDPEDMRKILYACNNCFRDSALKIEHRIQSNLLLYNGKWRDLIKELFVGGIGTSIDYPNLYRKTPRLTPDEYTTRWKEKVSEAQEDGFSLGVIVLPNSETFVRGADAFYHFFMYEAGISNVQVNFPFCTEYSRGDIDRSYIPGREQFADFMERLFFVWQRNGREMSLNPFERFAMFLKDRHSGMTCLWAYSCSKDIVAISGEGKVALCDAWVSGLDYNDYGRFPGRSLDNILASPVRAAILERPRRLLQETECGECKYWKMCHGGCPLRAYTLNGSLYSPDYYCDVYKKIFRHLFENP